MGHWLGPGSIWGVAAFGTVAEIRQPFRGDARKTGPAGRQSVPLFSERAAASVADPNVAATDDIEVAPVDRTGWRRK